MSTYIKTLCFSTVKNVRGKANIKMLTNISATAKYCSSVPHCSFHSKLRPVLFMKQPRQNLWTTSKLAGKVEFTLSDIGEGITEVVVKEWYVKPGDVVQQFDNICEVQSDKASVTITSRYDGKITKLYYNVDDTALVGKPLIEIETESGEAEVPENDPTLSQNAVQQTTKRTETYSDTDDENKSVRDKALATPAVRRLAREYQIPIELVPGTGKHGRVLKEDVLEYFQNEQNKETEIKTNIPEDNRVRITGIQKAMFKTMTKANNIPHFTYTDEVSVRKLVELRSQMKDVSGIKVTFLPFFMKAMSKCLSEFPILNSALDESLEYIIYKLEHNIGFAVDTPQGLQVPNVKNVNRLNIVEIAQELNRLQKLGLEGRLRQEDLSGGTFTISNIGSIGGMFATPILLPPEVGILAIGRIQTLPRYTSDGNITKDEIICVSWSADHRIIDGATVAKCSNLWKELVQNPHRLLF